MGSSLPNIESLHISDAEDEENRAEPAESPSEDDADVSTEGNASSSRRARRLSRSKRAGLHFPVSRFHAILRQSRVAQRIAKDVPVYLAAVVEYLVAEVLDVAVKAATDNRRSRVTPRFIQLAVQEDEELRNLLSQVIIREAGVRPHIQPRLLPPRNKRGKKKNQKVLQANMN